MAEPEKEKRGIWSRRDFFTRLGWGGFGIFGGLSLLGFLRSAFPRVLFQPPATFKAGFPNEIQIGQVDERFKQKNAVWLVRTAFDQYANGKAFLHCPRYARISAAHRTGWNRNRNSSVRVTAAATTRRALTLKAPRRGRWNALRSASRMMGRSWWTRAGNSNKKKANGRILPRS